MPENSPWISTYAKFCVSLHFVAGRCFAAHRIMHGIIEEHNSCTTIFQNGISMFKRIQNWCHSNSKYTLQCLKIAKIVSFLLSEKWLDGVYEDFCWDFFCIFTHAIQLPNLKK